MSETSARGRSLGLKILLVGGLVLALGVPLAIVNVLAWERENRAQTVAVEVGAALGGAQTFRGPYLSIPFETVQVTETGRGEDLVRTETVLREHIVVSPEVLDLWVRLETHTLRRAIYTVPAYRSDMQMTATFDLQGVAALAPADATISWEQARIFATVSDLRGISEDFNAQASTQEAPLAFEPGMTFTMGESRNGRAISAAIAGISDGARVEFTGELVMTGARSFALQPSGRETRAEITGDWPHPGFDGSYLPAERETGAEGFSASWLVPYLARGFPARWVEGRSYSLSNAHGAAMTVNLVNPADGYARVSRSLKYAIFFVGFTLLMFFLIEASGSQRLHAAQYILIGLAQVVFYLMLLALSEHASIAIAFSGSAAATIVLTALYAWTAFKDNARAMLTFAALTLSYVIQFLLVLIEEYALLIGAGLTFLAIAGTMYVTRKVDWYGITESKP